MSLLSDVKVLHVQGVVLDELPARLDLVAHEQGEHLLGLDRVGQSDRAAASLLGVHGGLEELLGIHFAQALEPLDLQARAAPPL